MSLNLPLLIVGAFLVLTLIVGLTSKKATTFREYAVDTKRLPTAILVTTLLATSLGGGALLTNVIRVYQHGLWWIVHMLLGFIDFWVTSSILALRIGPFMKHLSVAETIGKIYGKYPRIITALSCICFCIFVVTIQIHALSLAITMCIDSVDTRLITMLATLTLVAYAAFGGIRAITITDVLQFVTFTTIIFVLAKLMFAKTDKSIFEIASFLQKQEKFQFSNTYRLKPLNLFFLVLHHFSFILDPILTQRIYMSSSPIQAKKAFLYANFFQMFIFMAIMLISLFVFVKNPTLPETKVWGYIMANVPPVFKGCIAISLLGMTMSTADSSLHVCSVIVGHDIMESIGGIKGSPSCAHQIWLAKLTSIVIGILSMIIVFYSNNLLELLIQSMELYASIVVAPLILAVFGFRGTARTALIGMATGVLAILAWNRWVIPSTGIEGDFFCIIANGLAMMAAHYLFPQPTGTGWVRPDNQHRRMQQLADAFKRHRKILDLE